MEKICCIFIGSTGCGKSLLIKNMCYNSHEIKVGHTHKSTTKDIKIMSHKTNSNLILMDTMGCEDTNEDWTDKEISREITTKLAECQAPKIKVVWCVKPNDKSTPTLQKQAKFIDALVNKKWNAVQIIVKLGMLKSHSQGALMAAKDIGNSSYTVNSYNIHCLDMIPEKEKEDCMLYLCAKNMKKIERIKGGLLNKSELCDAVTNLINKLSAAKKEGLVKYFKHKTSGRLISIKEHVGTIARKYQHTGYIKRTYKHHAYLDKPRGHTTECDTRKTIVKKHRGYVTTKVYHTVTRVRTRTYTKTECPFHSSCSLDYRHYRSSSWVSTWRCYKCNCEIYAGENFYHCNSYCERGGSSHYPCVVKCDGMICTGCAKKRYTESKWVCCGQSESSSGCQSKRIYTECGCREYSSPCTMTGYKYPCGKDSCKRIYSRCKCIEGNTPNSGCQIDTETWSCCQKGKNEDCDNYTSYYRGCGHEKNSPACHVKEKRWDCCGALENEKLTKQCGEWKWVPKNFE